jgi:hypothetical protein
MAYAKLFAVTGLPSANLNVDFRLNVYVLPFAETAGSDLATSGEIFVPPALASLSGKLRSLHDVAYCICQPCEK